MIRSCKFLLRPAGRQQAPLAQPLRDHCFLCDGAPQERRQACAHPSKTKIEYGDQSARLKEIRSFAPQRQGR
ncbi:hypothetical protein [Nocardiopsis sp. CNT312]|uniref:hypothetical protein n=1 Tax=Nocardiopsis sp. CNT312 TaxID=1137268 RepID=UPI00048CA824|nr:hypothetical protein [Nocardiopsis sp. CNT312]